MKHWLKKMPSPQSKNIIHYNKLLAGQAFFKNLVFRDWIIVRTTSKKEFVKIIKSDNDNLTEPTFFYINVFFFTEVQYPKSLL